MTSSLRHLDSMKAIASILHRPEVIKTLQTRFSLQSNQADIPWVPNVPSSTQHAITGLRNVNNSSRRAILSSTRSLLRISEEQHSEEAALATAALTADAASSAAPPNIVAVSALLSSSKTGVVPGNRASVGSSLARSNANSLVSGTGLARTAFMSSRETLRAMGSNFQLNNIVHEEAEEEEETVDGEVGGKGDTCKQGGRVQETRVKGLYASKSCNNVEGRSASSLHRQAHGLGNSGVNKSGNFACSNPKMQESQRLTRLRDHMDGDEDEETSSDEDDDHDLIHSGFNDANALYSTFSALPLLSHPGSSSELRTNESNNSLEHSIRISSITPPRTQSTQSMSNVGQAGDSREIEIESQTTLNQPESEPPNQLASRQRIVFRQLSLRTSLRAAQGFIFRKSVVSVDRLILKNLEGVFLPESLTAIMGISDEETSGLLFATAGRYKQGCVSVESILMNGSELHTEDIGFVYQSDLLWTSMTVREAIAMAVQSRNPDFTLNEMSAAVEKITNAMRLKQCENSVIGEPGAKGISSFDRRRCSIAMAIASSPTCLFLDHPTRGLDYLSAISLIRMLKNLASDGATVVMTADAPKSDEFKLFDHLILLAEGQIMYQGPAEHSTTYFASLGYSCPSRCNPADYFVKSILNPEKSRDTENTIPAKIRIENLTEAWSCSIEYRNLQKAMLDVGNNEKASKSCQKQCCRMNQIRLLLKRAVHTALRDRSFFKAYLVKAIFIPFLLGFVFYQVNLRNDFAAIQNRIGLLFFLVAANSFISLSMSLYTFGRQYSVCERESDLGFYCVRSFFAVKILQESSAELSASILQVLVVYFLAGLQTTAPSIFMAICTIFLTSLVSSLFGIMLAVNSPSLEVALLNTLVLVTLWMLFGGIFVNFNLVAPALSWLQWLSPIRYAYESLVKMEFAGLLLETPTFGFRGAPAMPQGMLRDNDSASADTNQMISKRNSSDYENNFSEFIDDSDRSQWGSFASLPNLELFARKGLETEVPSKDRSLPSPTFGSGMVGNPEFMDPGSSSSSINEFTSILGMHDLGPNFNSYDPYGHQFHQNNLPHPNQPFDLPTGCASYRQQSKPHDLNPYDADSDELSPPRTGLGKYPFREEEQKQHKSSYRDDKTLSGEKMLPSQPHDLTSTEIFSSTASSDGMGTFNEPWGYEAHIPLSMMHPPLGNGHDGEGFDFPLPDHSGMTNATGLLQPNFHFPHHFYPHAPFPDSQPHPFADPSFLMFYTDGANPTQLPMTNTAPSNVYEYSSDVVAPRPPPPMAAPAAVGRRRQTKKSSPISASTAAGSGGAKPSSPTARSCAPGRGQIMVLTESGDMIAEDDDTHSTAGAKGSVPRRYMCNGRGRTLVRVKAVIGSSPF
ncbi:ATP-binding cassette sub- G member 2 [Chytriomyces hyalinus]|nr:ATP-binding cassette sub- G member 2 [Chytriomyces hyalinus]